jgi:hypothetical protein
MDLLDRVVEPGSDLLARVDEILSRHGAPAAHPVWALLHRLGALPSVALDQVAGLVPSEISAVGTPLAVIASDLHTAIASVPPDVTSRGVTADGFGARWNGLAGQIGDGADRLSATAAAVAELADWAGTARRDLAGALGACLGSAEAVLVRSAPVTGDADSIRAAADIAADVLESIARMVDSGWQCFGDWSGLDAEAPVTTSAVDGPLVPNHIELH